MESYLLESMSTAIIALDKTLCFQYLNSSAETLLEQSSSRTRGMPVTSLIHQQELHNDLARALTQKQRFIRRETPLEINGKIMTVDYSVIPLENPETRILLEINTLDRLRRITREESQHNKQEVSRILARGLAHEIKNPLGGIRGAAQLLARMLKEPSLLDYTEVIIQEADRLRDLVDRMLGPLTPPKIAAVNIHEILERVTQLITAETEGALHIVRDYDPSIPDIPADKELLIQAFLNLARNAMQAIAQSMAISDGQIIIRSRVTRQFTMNSERRRLVCHIAIIDNGPGIPDYLKESIFYPMISGRPEGTGLGLPMAQSIISQHQGLIECESQPGRTSFDIYLPLTQPYNQAITKKRSFS
ncbi:nitrogen regulation protein NR(II) [Endozoicomonas sp. Mp262]